MSTHHSAKRGALSPARAGGEGAALLVPFLWRGHNVQGDGLAGAQRVCKCVYVGCACRRARLDDSTQCDWALAWGVAWTCWLVLLLVSCCVTDVFLFELFR